MPLAANSKSIVCRVVSPRLINGHCNASPGKAGDCSAGEDDARSPTKMRSVSRSVGMNPDIRSLVAVILELAESGKWARGLQL